jgi:hypothetical protein
LHLLCAKPKSKQMTQQELKEKIQLHSLWLRGEAGGQRGCLIGADLSGADLRKDDVSGADLSWAKGIYQFGPMPTSTRICYAVWHGDHWMVQAGCFWGTLDELEAKVRELHNCPVYLANIEILRNWKYEAQ